MRTSFTTILLFLFFTISAQPKTITTQFGFIGGLNHSVVNGKDSMGAKTGYIGTELYGGFFADSRLGSKWNLENELLFSWTDDYHFIEVPIHLKYKFSDKWAAFFGPKLDFIADDDNDPFESNYNFRNFGVSADLGIQYNILKRLFAEGRFSKSFTQQITDHFLDINNGKRNTFRIGAGFRF
jgi:outer membrane protein with beta-barrel domain